VHGLALGQRSNHRHHRHGGRRHRRLDLCSSANLGKPERRGNANELWREYLRLAFDNPKLSDPTLKLADFNYADLIVDGSKETFQKYELFVDTSSMPARRFWKSCPQRNGTQRSASNSACIGSI
jgi:hypothetical protein